MDYDCIVVRFPCNSDSDGNGNACKELNVWPNNMAMHVDSCLKQCPIIPKNLMLCFLAGPVSKEGGWICGGRMLDCCTSTGKVKKRSLISGFRLL